MGADKLGISLHFFEELYFDVGLLNLTPKEAEKIGCKVVSNSSSPNFKSDIKKEM